MKIMNYLLTIVLLFMVGSCSKETPSNNEDLAIVDFQGRMSSKNEKPQEIFELDVQQYYLLGELAKLDRRKKELEEGIEGGRKELLPKWESVVKEFDYKESQLIDLREKICVFLEVRIKYLVEQAKKGNVEAQEELAKTEKSRENCGIDIENYLEASKYIAFIRVPPTGACDNPGPEFDACQYPLVEGQVVVNVEEKLDRLTLTTQKGRPVAEGELTGESMEIEGFVQYSFEAPPSMDHGFLSVSNGSESYKASIEVLHDF